jgi:hypothetical protein
VVRLPDRKERPDDDAPRTAVGVGCAGRAGRMLVERGDDDLRINGSDDFAVL